MTVILQYSFSTLSLVSIKMIPNDREWIQVNVTNALVTNAVLPLFYNPSLVLLQCLLFALYRILFPVFILTHCGTGRFMFILCASLRLMMNVLWELIVMIDVVLTVTRMFLISVTISSLIFFICPM